MERRTLAQIQRHLKGNRQKKWSRIGQQHLPRLWLFTDPVKTPDLAAVLNTLPRRCGIGVVIRARSREEEITWIRIVKRAMATRGITGYLVRWSRWRQGYYSGQLGWHVTTKSPPLTVSTIKWNMIVSGTWHPRTEPFCQAHRPPKKSLIFVSPVNQTTSHPNQAILGTIRYRLIYQRIKHAVAMGGITTEKYKTLPQNSSAAGIDLFR